MEVKEIEGIKAVRFSTGCVAAIAYTMDNNGLLQQIGIVTEKNPHFEKGVSENLVMGVVEKEDTSLLQRAMIELKEEAGYEVEDSQRWTYLGSIYTSKVTPDPIFLFAVNVTDMTGEKPKGDESGTEEILSFSLVPIKQALDIGDSIILSAFFKLFMQIYQKDFKPNQ